MGLIFGNKGAFVPNYVLIAGVFTPFTYTVPEIDAMMSVVPISRFGDLTAAAIPFSVSSNAVTIGPVPAFMSGRAYNLAATPVPITPTANKTYYLYLKLVEGQLGILSSETTLDETITQMYIGKVAIGANGVLDTGDVTLEKVTRIDIYRLSPTRRGTAIPVSTGDPTGTGNFAW